MFNTILKLKEKQNELVLKGFVKLSNIKLMKKQEGLTTVEYAVAGALIAAATVTAFTQLGTTVTGTITNINAAIAGG